MRRRFFLLARSHQNLGIAIFLSKSEMSNDKMSNDKMSNDKMSNNKMSNDKMLKLILCIDFRMYV
jgi:pentapeptide MXKDX repeat protein